MWDIYNWGFKRTQRAQYALIREDTPNYKGLHTIIYAIFLNSGVLGSLGTFLGRFALVVVAVVVVFHGWGILRWPTIGALIITYTTTVDGQNPA